MASKSPDITLSKWSPAAFETPVPISESVCPTPSRYIRWTSYPATVVLPLPLATSTTPLATLATLLAVFIIKLTVCLPVLAKMTLLSSRSL